MGKQIKDNNTGGACGTHGTEYKWE